MRGNKRGLRLCCAGYDAGAATFEGSGETHELVQYASEGPHVADVAIQKGLWVTIQKVLRVCV